MKKRECNNEKSKKSTENHALTFILSHNTRTNAAEDRKGFSLWSSCGMHEMLSRFLADFKQQKK